MSETRTVISIEGDRFLVNGSLTYPGRSWRGKSVEGLLFNSRMANAIIDDKNPETRGTWAYLDGEFTPERNTGEFIAALSDYHAHGLRAVSINLQGGSPQGYSWNQPWRTSGFRPDGTITADYQQRLQQVIAACDRVGMIIILGLFYWKQSQVLADEAAVRNAAATVVDLLYRAVRETYSWKSAMKSIFPTRMASLAWSGATNWSSWLRIALPASLIRPRNVFWSAPASFTLHGSATTC